MSVNTNSLRPISPPEVSPPSSPLNLPLKWHRFGTSFDAKIREGLVLGAPSTVSPTVEGAQLARMRCAARHVLSQEVLLHPTDAALQRTKLAARAFFRIAYQHVQDTKENFPLFERNKCLGMVAIPRSKLVLVAVSQDKDPIQDIELRKKMVEFLQQMTSKSTKWVFELVRLPTPSAYVFLRTFQMRSPHRAPKELVEPHTRCVEVALAVALCKVGRFHKFAPSEAAVVPFGGAMWMSIDGQEAKKGFGGISRNSKYLSQPALDVTLSDSEMGYVDIWDPCKVHCRIFMRDLLAMGAAGGPGTSFIEPRAESKI